MADPAEVTTELTATQYVILAECALHACFQGLVHSMRSRIMPGAWAGGYLV